MQKSDDFSLFSVNLKTAISGEISVRLLAYLGDAVFELYQREKEVVNLQTSANLHRKVVSRVNARAQSAMLETLKELLTAEELNLVRRARNLKTSGPRRTDQSNYRRATAFEALVGHLYLTNQARLKQLLLAAEQEPKAKLDQLQPLCAGGQSEIEQPASQSAASESEPEQPESQCAASESDPNQPQP